MAKEKTKSNKLFEAEIAGLHTLKELNSYTLAIKDEFELLGDKDKEAVKIILRAKRAEVPHIERNDCREILRHSLTKEELADISSEMAQAQITCEGAEADKKTSAAQFDSVIKSSKSTISHNARLFRDGYDMRNINCERVKDFNEKTITLIRTDTNEVVNTRKMTTDELQMSLPIDLV